MKKILSLILCLAVFMALASTALAAAAPGFGSDPQVVKDFVALVNAIGEVTLEDKEAIEAAEDYLLTVVNTNNGMTFYARYIEKTGDGIMDRGNPNARAAYATLQEARKQYDALVAGGDTTPTTAPQAPTTAPVAPTTVPQAPTTVPQAPTTVPQAPTTVPQAPTTVPQAPTTVPQAPTTVPQAPTTVPQAPTTAAPETPTQPSTPSDPVDPNGDGTFMVIALAVLSMTALVVLVSKKRAF